MSAARHSVAAGLERPLSERPGPEPVASTNRCSLGSSMDIFTRFFGRSRDSVPHDSPAESEAPEPEVHESGAPEPEAGLSMQADRPIQNIADDKFDRAPFAVQIAKVIATRSDPSSLVVGLYGPWGDGKTSVLSMIRESLELYPAVIPMDYNPWFYGSSTEAITRSFFKSLSEALEKSKALSRENIGQLMTTLGKAIPHVGEAVAAVGETMATEALTDTRDKVGEILKRHGKKIVIFIDDIDRLDRADIQTLFKLVRLSGGFDHTTYILAFDDEVVAEALGEAYGAGDPVAGRRFLEKIVQVPLHLPPANPETLRQLIFSACNRAIQANGLELADGQNFELGNNLSEGVGGVLKTPRQTKLFDNAITFAIPLLKGEVRVVDQILIEAIRIFYPSIYQAVRSNPSRVLSGPERDAHQPIPQSPIDAALSALSVVETERAQVRNLLEHLFPRLGRMNYGPEWDRTWAVEKRICSRDYFDRYFTYAVPTGDFSDQSVAAVVTAAVEEDEATVTHIVQSAFDRDAVTLLIRKLRAREETMDTRSARGLALAFATRASRFPVKHDIFVRNFTLTQGAVFISKLAARLEPAEQDALMADIAEQADTLHFVQEVINSAAARVSERGEAYGFLEPDRLHPLAEILLRRLKEGAGEVGLFAAAEDHLGRVIYCIEATGSANTVVELRRFLTETLTELPGNAGQFLRAFTGRSQGDSGIIGYSDFTRNTYTAVAELLDPNLIFSQLRQVHGPDLEHAVWEQDWEGTADIDNRIARQFAAIHRNPNARDVADD